MPIENEQDSHHFNPIEARGASGKRAESCYSHAITGGKSRRQAHRAENKANRAAWRVACKAVSR